MLPNAGLGKVLDSLRGRHYKCSAQLEPREERRPMRPIIPLSAAALGMSAPVLAAEMVPVPAFTAIELSNGGDVELRRGPVQRVTIVEGSSQFTSVRVVRDRKLSIDACNARCPRHYRLRILIESPSVPVLGVSGGGRITAAPGFGSQRDLTVAVGGGGGIDVRAVPAEVATAAVSGGGAIKVRARRVLTAAVNGGGDIQYWGNPTVTSAINGGGIVRPAS